MSEISVTQPRTLLPRRLDQQETLNSLNQWVITFKNFYRRCNFYSYFLQPGVTWNKNARDRGFSAETSGLNRSAEILGSDLEGFLQTLSSFLPFDYVAAKLCSETTDMKSVWKVIYEIYDLEITSSNFLDYATMTKLQDESYRGFYNRLVGFVRQHLPQSSYEADGVVSTDTGEELSISLLDTVAIHWLLAIDKRLISIVKTELATDLKTKRICQLVKQIAPNIDEWLNRYAQGDIISSVNIQQTRPATNEDPSIAAIIHRLEKLETGNRSRTWRGRNNNRTIRNSRPPLICGHCSYLNRQLGASLDVKHSSQQCQRKQLSINVLETMEQDSPEPYEELDLHEEGEKLYNSKQTSTLPSLQIFNTEEPFTTCAESDLKPIVLSNLLNDSDNVVSTISDNSYSNKEAQTNCINPSCKPIRSLDLSQGTNSNCTTMEQSIFSASLFKLSESTFAWNGVSKSKSPKLPVSLNNISAPALLDSGAELNVLDADFAMKAGIVFINTSVVARAANKQTLNVQGQSQTDVTLNCVTEEGSKMISLGIVLIVKGLGIACIIGQPGILSNNIIYLPKKNLLCSQEVKIFIKFLWVNQMSIILLQELM